MTKNTVVILLFSFLILICFSNSLLANAEIDKKLLNKIFNETRVRLDELLTLKEITKFDVKIVPWGNNIIGLLDHEYGSPEKKKQIKNMPTAEIRIDFASGLHVFMRFANFKNDKDAQLGYGDSIPPSAMSKNCLISGETIENAFIETSDYQDAVLGYLVYKGCVLYFSSAIKPSHKLDANDYKIIDNFVKLFKAIIDKSIKNSN